jgi:hypothetical protein
MSFVTSELERRSKAAKEELQNIALQVAGIRSIGDSLRAVADSIKEVDGMPSIMTDKQIADQQDELDEHEAERRLLNLVNDINAFIAQVNDGIKGRLGAPSVRSFLREIRTKLQAMLDGVPKAKQEAMSAKLAEINSKIASLEETARTFEIEVDALPDDCFGLVESGGEKDENGKTIPRSLRLFPYKGENGKVNANLLTKSLRDLAASPITESQRAAVRSKLMYAAKGADIEIGNLREGAGRRVVNCEVDNRITLHEASYDTGRGELTVALIEAGTNPAKKRHYPESTIREAAPHFAGLKMYINHPTKTEVKERPERDLRDWASTITESWYDGGKAMGKVAVHAGFLRELLSDSVARKHIGLSINTQGVSEDSVIDGQKMQVIKQIVVEKGEHGRKSSVDWVTEAGARGRVIEVLESRRNDTMALETLQLSDLKADRPDLVETIRTETEKETRAKVEKEVKTKMEGEIKEAFGKLETRVGGIEGDLKKSKQENTIRQELAKTKLPAKMQEQIVEALAGQTFETPAKLTEAVTAKVKESIDLIKSMGFNVKDDGGSGASSGSKGLVETLGEQLDSRAGIAPAKKD